MIHQDWVQRVASEVVARIASYADAVPVSRFRFDGEIPSSRAGQPQYHVTVAATSDDATCTCVAFTKWNRGGDCSHIKMVRSMLAM